MPLKRCQHNGKSGWKWGNSGKCYTGPGAKQKAIKQGVAIEGPDKFAQKASAEEYELALSCIDGMANRVALVLSRK